MPDYLFTLHAYGTWMPDRPEGSVHWKRGYQPQNVKHALTIRLNERVGRRTWFSKGGHRKPIADAKHFDYRCDEYLPTHSGLGWDARRGWC